MTTTPASPTSPATGPTAGRKPRGVVFRRVAAPAVPVWHAAFLNPYSDGHIRLEGLSWTERQAARMGLVTLVLLLGSLLAADVWRSGTLLPIGDGTGLRYLPEGLLAVTLVTFLVAWVMLTWGALTSAWWVRVVVAAGFILLNASLSKPGSFEVGDHLSMRIGPDLIRWSYFAVAALVLASIALRWLPAKVAARTLPVVRLLVALGLGVFFLSHLWIDVAFVEEGFAAGSQVLVATSITEIDGVMMPLVFVTAVLVIDFGLNVATGVARSARETRGRWLRWVVVALLAVKLWFGLFDELGDWAAYVRDRPQAVVRTVVSVALLAALVRWVAHRPVTEAVDGAKERLLYLMGLLLALPVVVSVLVVGAGVFTLTQLDSSEMPGLIQHYPAADVTTYGQPAVIAGGILVGVWLLRRRRSAMDVELGSGLVVVGAWALPSLLVNMTSWELGFSDELVDVVVTLAVAVVVAVAWRRIDTRLGVVLAAVLVFSWLTFSKGDWIALAGNLFGLPAVLVVVVAVIFSVLGDAGFTRTGGRFVPQGARVLMFVGYLVLSVTLLHWVETTHGPSQSAFQADAAFYFIGIPWAAWIVARKLVHLQLDDPAS